MSINSFILILVKLINIYGVSIRIYSDNYKITTSNEGSFITGCNFIKEIPSSNAFACKFNKYNVKHWTIPLYPVWFNSALDYLIWTIKIFFGGGVVKESITLSCLRLYLIYSIQSTPYISIFWRFLFRSYIYCFILIKTEELYWKLVSRTYLVLNLFQGLILLILLRLIIFCLKNFIRVGILKAFSAWENRVRIYISLLLKTIRLMMFF